MKKKELKNLAKKIAQNEYVIQNNKDGKAVVKAQLDTMILLSKITDFEEMDILDEMVQKILDKMSKEVE